MKCRSLCNFAAKIVLFLIVLCLAIGQFFVAFQEQRSYRERAGAAITHNQKNPFTLTWHAKQKQTFDADFEAANDLLQTALIVNPLYIPAWLQLAELKKEEGDSSKADAILEYIHNLTGHVKRWKWEKALLAYQLDRKDIVAEDLVYIIEKIPGKLRNDACRMVFTIWKDMDELKSIVGSDNIQHLFRLAVKEKRAIEALALWPALEVDEVNVYEKDVFAFINMLIRSEYEEDAISIWKMRYAQDQILFNGDFNSPPLQTAFGWRIQDIKGASWRIETSRDGKEVRSLKVHFNRKHNLNYHHAYQFVPVIGGVDYTLRGELKSAKLTTEQLPYIEVYGYQCDGLYEKTDMVDPDQEWRSFELNFQVPEECNIISVRLRRKMSINIDNKLAGDVWLKGFLINDSGHFTDIEMESKIESGDIEPKGFKNRELDEVSDIELKSKITFNIKMTDLTVSDRRYSAEVDGVAQ